MLLTASYYEVKQNSNKPAAELYIGLKQALKILAVIYIIIGIYILSKP